MENLDLIVTSAFGIEAVTKRELKLLGIENAPADNGRLHFQGTLRDVARCNLFLRTADRVLIRLGKFSAQDFNALFEGISALPFERFCDVNSRILVSAKSVSSTLFALSAIQSIAKKAIVERLKKKLKTNTLPETGSSLHFEIAIIKDEVTVTLDTSGVALHKRGYRDLSAEAPLKETLAAAILLLSVWNPDRALVDPFCGSGTIPIEAAMIGQNIAPGINRSFAFEDWKTFDPSFIQEARQEAMDLMKKDRTLHIAGYDIDPSVVSMAIRHAKRAGVAEAIHFQKRDMRELSSRFSHGVVVTNPPYGERLLTEREVRALYTEFGKVFFHLDNWCCYTITAYPEFERFFGKRADKNRKLYNGRLECRLFQYLGTPPKKKTKEE